MDEQKLKERLSEDNEEFRNAYRLHQQYEDALKKLGEKKILTEEEKRRQKELKKMKLVLKDKMYYLMTKYHRSLS